MNQTRQQYLKELLWLTCCVMITYAFAILLFGIKFLRGVSDFHMHDTYFVIDQGSLLVPLFLLVTYSVYFTRSLKIKYKITVVNWILLTSGFLSVLTLTFLVKALGQFAYPVTSLYPPPSAPGPDKISQLKPDSLITLLTNFFIVIQNIVLLSLIYAMHRWGIQRKLKIAG